MAAPQRPSSPVRAVEPEHFEENGRFYTRAIRDTYMFPCDEQQTDQLDIFHGICLLARKNRLHKAPLRDMHGLRILDLGTGTGIWPLDMSHLYRTADIEGYDMSTLQPAMISQNVRFSAVDVEKELPNTGGYDMIYMRNMYGSIGSWENMYRKIFNHLLPGHGWIEHVEIDWQPRCDDHSLPPNARLLQWADELFSAMDVAGRPMRINSQDTKARLQAAGFDSIEEQVINVPFNSWPEARDQQDIGRWFCLAFNMGLQGMTLAPLSRVKQWPVIEINALVEDAKKEVTNKNYHVYCELHIWTARRPPSS